jgi:hypothetical protein
MSSPYDAAPSSLRKPVERSRFAQNLSLMSQTQRRIPIPDGSARAAVLSKSRFYRLPQEPEDARLTGVTRSLHRRLLALNLYGSLLRPVVLLDSRIA